MGDWGILAYDPEDEVLRGGIKDWPEHGGVGVYEVTFFDWLSRRVRPEVDRALSEFADDLASVQSEDEALALRVRYSDQLDALKKRSARLHDETVHLVLSTWLQRVKEDIEALASDKSGQRRRRGGREMNADVDQDELERLVHKALSQKRHLHSTGRRAGTPNKSRICQWLNDEYPDLIGNLDERSVRRRVAKAVASWYAQDTSGSTVDAEDELSWD